MSDKQTKEEYEKALKTVYDKSVDTVIGWITGDGVSHSEMDKAIRTSIVSFQLLEESKKKS